MVDALLRTVVVALGALGYLNAASLTVTAEEGLGGGVDEVDASDIDEIVVEAHHQRVGDSHPAALAVGLHVVFLPTDVEHHLAGLGSHHTEIGAAVFAYLRELVAWDGGLGEDGIVGPVDGLRHVDMGTYGLIAQETGDGLAVAAAQLAVAGGIEMQAVGTVGAAIRRDDL